ncbi:MAG: Bax inhibitor-1/YccA family protein, partial [Terracidiphilus sp.]
MALFKTSNPALGQNTFSDAARSQYGGNLVDAADRMSLSGTVNKTGILLLCAVATAAWTWNQFMQTHDPSSVAPELLLGALGGFIFAMVTIFK